MFSFIIERLRFRASGLPVTGKEGDIRLDSDDLLLKTWAGGEWKLIGSGAGGGGSGFLWMENQMDAPALDLVGLAKYKFPNEDGYKIESGFFVPSSYDSGPITLILPMVSKGQYSSTIKLTASLIKKDASFNTPTSADDFTFQSDDAVLANDYTIASLKFVDDDGKIDGGLVGPLDFIKLELTRIAESTGNFNSDDLLIFKNMAEIKIGD